MLAVEHSGNGGFRVHGSLPVVEGLGARPQKVAVCRMFLQRIREGDEPRGEILVAAFPFGGCRSSGVVGVDVVRHCLVLELVELGWIACW